MPDVPYLTGGESLTAARMNTLTEEADRRAALCLDDHSILYLLGESAAQTREDFAPYLGQVFHFVSGTQPISGYWGTWSYNHVLFENAVNNSVLLTTPNNGVGYPSPGPVGGHPRASESEKWVRINPLASSLFTTIGKIKSNANTDWRMSTSLLRFSLEAHRKLYTKDDGTQELFWIQETYSASSDTNGLNAFPVYLQRIHSFQQAELVFEGVTGDFTFPYKWNRFQFFRIHNLNGDVVRVNFKDANGATVHTVTVSAYQSKCVRRYPVAGTTYPEPTWAYLDGFKYFHKFIADDPRFYQHGAGNSTGANNVVNPSLYISFVNRLLAGTVATASNGALHRICRPTAIIDPSVRAPLPTSLPDLKDEPEARAYSSIYGTVSDSTLLGDLLHAKGKFKLVTVAGDGTVSVTEKTFSGYGTLGGIDGLTIQESGDTLQIKGTGGATYKDLIAVGTNFFATPNLSRPVADVTDWFSLDRHGPSIPAATIQETSVASIVSYYQVAAGGGLGPRVDQTITRKTLKFADAANTSVPVPHKHTLAEAKARYFGQQANDYSTLTTGVTLSSSGLVVYATQTIPLTHPWSQGETHTADLSIGDALSQNVIRPLQDFTHSLGNSWTKIHYDEGTSRWSLTRHVVFTGYGWPDTDSETGVLADAGAYCFSGFLTARLVRTYSDAGTSGGTGVPIAGEHPDFREGQTLFSVGSVNSDGRDFVYVGDGAGQHRLPCQLPTPVTRNNYRYGSAGRIDNPDVLYGALNNVGVGSYWTAATGVPEDTNRTRCGRNQIYYNVATDGSDFQHNAGQAGALAFYRFVRMEMAAEHYNNLAAKVNSIVRYVPLNWIDHGVIQNGSDQERRYFLRPNTQEIWTGILSSSWYRSLPTSEKNDFILRIKQLRGLRPAEQYAGSDSVTVAGYAGLPIKTIADLPDSFSTRKALNHQRGFLTYTASAVIEGDSVAPTGAGSWRHDFTIRVTGITMAPSARSDGTKLRPDLNALVDYNWIAIDDVKSYAESRGYKFLHVVFGAGFSLTLDETAFPSEVVEMPAPFPGSSNQFDPDPNSWTGRGLTGTGSSFHFPLRWLDFTESAGGSWIADSPSVEKVTDLPADLAVVKSSGILAGIQQQIILRLSDRANQYRVPLFFLKFPLSRAIRERFWYSRVDVSDNGTQPVYSTARNPAEYTNHIQCREPKTVVYAPAGFDGTEPVLSPVPHLEYVSDITNTTALCQFRNDFGTANISFTVQESGASRVQLWADFSRAV